MLPVVLNKSSVDDREYRIVVLGNQLEVLLVHDAFADKASAAIDVGVGNFNDDNDLPGVAHAVEHLLFMGTKKFPQENAYNQFLASNSGDSNAYTAPTSTNYYFDVSAHSYAEDGKDSKSPLYGAMDRFAQFFIDPLFLANTVDRELRAVDSENKKNLQSDNWRIHQLEKSLSNPKHPYCHFSTGNFEVLKTEPEARGVNVREKFMEFHDKYYSANQMKLVVLGRESLDTLQSWVTELFSDIPNKNLEVNKWTDEVPYNPEHLGLVTYVKPVMETRELALRFPALDETELDDSQPSRYVSHLIGHEGPGSIMSYIKGKGWANSLGSGMYPVCPGTPGIFQVTIRLTEEGLKAYDEVLAVFFQYVAMLRENPPLEWIFKEMKDLADVDFKFKQKTPPSRFTSRTSALMNRPIPREHLLSGPSCLHKFDPELIQKSIDFLRPDNMRITITSQTFPGNWDKKEKWYGTEYREDKIPADLLSKINKAYSTTKGDRIPALHLPHKNQFVPTKLEVEKKEVAEPAMAPRIIRNTELSRTWYKKDDTFWVPKGTLTLSIKNPAILAMAENYIKTDLFSYLVSDALEEYSYDADLAGLYYYVRVDDGCLVVEVSGYNDKLPVLLEQVLTKIRDLEIKDDRFDIIKERASRGLRNSVLQQPYQLISKYTAWITKPVYYTFEELAEELPSITAESVRSFVKELLGQMHIDIHVHGNFYKEDALKLTDMIESTLQARPLPRAQWPIRRDVVFPRSCNYVYNKKLSDKENVNHALEYVLYFPDRNRSTKARALLLDQLVHEPAWDQLRTKEQLGYVVFTGLRPGLATLGYRFLVQSEKVPKYLEERVDAFLTEFKKTLGKMSDETFEGYKRSLIAKRLEKPKNLNQEISRHWVQISSEFYDFDFAQKDVDEIKLLNKADLVKFFDEYIDPQSPARAKLAVHLVAQAKSDVTKDQIADLIKSLNLDEAAAAKAATAPADLQARLTTEKKDADREAKDIDSFKEYLTGSLGVIDEAKVTKAVETWKDISRYYQTANSTNSDTGSSTVNGTTPVEIKNIRDFRTSMALSSGPQPEADISEFLDVGNKL